MILRLLNHFNAKYIIIILSINLYYSDEQISSHDQSRSLIIALIRKKINLVIGYNAYSLSKTLSSDTSIPRTI